MCAIVIVCPVVEDVLCVVLYFAFVVEKFKSNPLMVGLFRVFLRLFCRYFVSFRGRIGTISILLTLVQFDWLLKIRDNDDNAVRSNGKMIPSMKIFSLN